MKKSVKLNEGDTIEYHCTRCSEVYVRFTLVHKTQYIMSVPKHELHATQKGRAKNGHNIYAFKCGTCNHIDTFTIPIDLTRATSMPES
jgi:transcription elongation factor Elf1